jgi:hypothetical protein
VVSRTKVAVELSRRRRQKRRGTGGTPFWTNRTHEPAWTQETIITTIIDDARLPRGTATMPTHRTIDGMIDRGTGTRGAIAMTGPAALPVVG